MASYIHDLVVYLRDSYHPPGPVRFNLAVEPVELDVTQAVPLGLIINEAVTNAFKYAFPRDRAGTITLGLKATATRRTNWRLPTTAWACRPGMSRRGAVRWA
jgi:two-component sensor histidine kinase